MGPLAFKHADQAAPVRVVLVFYVVDAESPFLARRKELHRILHMLGKKPLKRPIRKHSAAR